jgi:hypothetical protein
MPTIRGRRRSNSPDSAVLDHGLRSWKKALVGIALMLPALFVVGYASNHLISLVQALSMRASVIFVSSLAYGIVLISLATSFIGGAILLEALGVRRVIDKSGTIFAIVLACLASGVLLMLAGGYINGVLLDRHGYTDCKYISPSRSSLTVWASSAPACGRVTGSLKSR